MTLEGSRPLTPGHLGYNTNAVESGICFQIIQERAKSSTEVGMNTIGRIGREQTIIEFERLILKRSSYYSSPFL